MVAVKGPWLSGPGNSPSTSSSRRVPSSLMEDFGQYGTLAARHMARWQPSTYAAIPAGEREAYFRELDERVTDAILDRERSFQPPPSLQEKDFSEYVGQMKMAHLMAEEEVLGELVFLPPEPGLESEADEPGTAPNGGWVDPGWRDPMTALVETDEEWEATQAVGEWRPMAQPPPKNNEGPR